MFYYFCKSKDLSNRYETKINIKNHLIIQNY